MMRALLASVGVLVAIGFSGPAAWAGPPAFAPAVNFELGPEREGTVVSGDFDEDGKQDVLYAPGGSGDQLQLLKGTGTGELTISAAVPSGGYNAGRLATGDFDEDGHLDIVLIGQRAGVVFGTGTGSFARFYELNDTGGSLNDAVVTDLDGDRHLDLVTTGIGLRTFVGNGKGTFSFKSNSSVAASNLTAGDVNLDSKPDVLATNPLGQGDAQERVSMLLGKGDGSLGDVKTFDFDDRAGSTAIGDFDEDGKPDIAVETPLQMKVLIGDGAGGLSPRTSTRSTFADWAQKIQAIDVNYDGHLDIVATQLGSGVFIKAGDGKAGLAADLPLSTPSRSVYSTTPALTDLDADSRPDVVLPSFSIGADANSQDDDRTFVSVFRNISELPQRPVTPVSDTGGQSASSPTTSSGTQPTKPRDLVAPRLTSAKLAAAVFAVDSKAKASAKKRIPRGTRLTFRLSEAATLAVTTEQLVKGRWRKVSTFTRRFGTGKGTLRYSGKLKVRGKSRTLKPGRYRLRIRPTDASKNAGRLITLKLRVVSAG